MTPRCENCHTVVSKAYARVSGDNEGVVWSCPSCRVRAPGAGSIDDLRPKQDADDPLTVPIGAAISTRKKKPKATEAD